MKKYLSYVTLGWFFLILTTAALANSAISKILMNDEMVKNFEFLKLSPYILHIGIAELVAILLLLVPRTSLLGVLMITSLMSGAAALHLSMMGGNDFLFPVTIAVMAWAGHCMRKYC